MYINGFTVLVDPPRLQKSIVKRAWRERLFTRPFSPFKKTKEVEVWVDILVDGQVIKSGNNLICNQKTYDCFKKLS